MLPPECEADSFPVVILRNVYTAAEAEAPGQEQDQFFADLEMDMLQEVRVCVCVTITIYRRLFRHASLPIDPLSIF